jgi:exonuclease III
MHDKIVCSSIYEGAKPDEPRGCRLRIGNVNVGTLVKRSGEVVEMVGRRKLDFCCVQESRWKGEGARVLGGSGKRYKFFWKGSDKGIGGVGIFVAEQYIDKVLEVRRVCDRMIVLKVLIGQAVMNVISCYAPQSGRPIEEKNEFWSLLDETVSELSECEKFIICGDLNAHVGESADGFWAVHGGYGIGERNVEGEVMLEWAEASELAVVNTWFKKSFDKRVTYESGDSKTQIDYILVKRAELSTVKDIKVMEEECIQQHRLLVCVLDVKGKSKKRKEKPISRCRVWKLKDEKVHDQFLDDFQSILAGKKVEGVEQIWNVLKNGLLETANRVCGRTKGRPKQRETWWWNDEVARVVDEKRRLFKVWKKSKIEADRTAYTRAKKVARAAVAKAQEAGRKDFGDMLDKAEKEVKYLRLPSRWYRKTGI